MMRPLTMSSSGKRPQPMEVIDLTDDNTPSTYTKSQHLGPMYNSVNMTNAYNTPAAKKVKLEPRQTGQAPFSTPKAIQFVQNPYNDKVKQETSAMVPRAGPDAAQKLELEDVKPSQVLPDSRYQDSEEQLLKEAASLHQQGLQWLHSPAGQASRWQHMYDQEDSRWAYGRFRFTEFVRQLTVDIIYQCLKRSLWRDELESELLIEGKLRWIYIMFREFCKEYYFNRLYSAFITWQANHSEIIANYTGEAGSTSESATRQSLADQENQRTGWEAYLKRQSVSSLSDLNISLNTNPGLVHSLFYHFRARGYSRNRMTGPGRSSEASQSLALNTAWPYNVPGSPAANLVPVFHGADDFQTFLDELQEEEVDENEGTNTAQEVADAAEAIGAERLVDNKYALPGLRCTLHPHQVIGVAWMCKREQQNDEKGKRSKVRGGILADAMGLGKTIQALGVMLKNQPIKPKSNQKRARTTLIVCPVALIYQWEREIKQKAPGQFKSIKIHHGQNKLRTREEFQEADVVITSYGTLAREYPIKKLKKGTTTEERIAQAERVDREKGMLFRVNFYRFILDEAHTIKNPSANVSIACCEIDSIRQWCLTGTPFQNRVEDIFPLFSVLNVPYFSDRAKFNRDIQNTKLGAEKLRGVLAPFLKRRNKDDKIAGLKVLTLPQKHVDLKILELQADEKKLYKQVEAQMVETINKFLQEGVAVKKFNHIFIMILRLRQLCIHPYLILEHLASKNDFDQGDFIQNATSMQSFTNLFQDGLLGDAAAVICSICFDEASNPVVARGCRHCFCSGCAKDQLEDPEAVCPACSSPVGALVKYDPRVHQPALYGAENQLETAHCNNLAIDSKAAVIKPETAEDLESIVSTPISSIKYEEISSGSSEPGDGDESVIESKLSSPTDTTLARREDNQLQELGSDDELPDLDIRNIRSSSGVKTETPVKSEGHVKAEPFLQAIKSDPATLQRSRSSSGSTAQVLSPTHDSAINAMNGQLHRSTITTSSSFGKRRLPAGFHRNEVTNDKPNKNDAEWQALLAMDYIPSTKLDAVEAQLRTWMTQDGSKIIVFSQFVKALDLVEKVCDMNDYPVLRYHGSMNMRERECTIAQFEDVEGPRILLMSLKAGGVGLNLVCASKVLMLDFWWNAAVEHQAVDRCHRMGQTKEVVVIRTYFPGTVEEKILALQEAKLKTAGTVLGEHEGGGKMAKLGLRELLGLFGRVTTDSDGIQQIVAHSSSNL